MDLFNVFWLVVVFIGLMIAEVPSNWLIKKFSPASVLCGECLILGMESISTNLMLIMLMSGRNCNNLSRPSPKFR